jgi:ADP-ribose pyrophosphatase YjhB (NUDIX family)
LLLNFLARTWNSLAGPVRGRLAWLTHAKFIHGVSGIIRDERGRVLLLRHRFWKEQPWGLPGGLANRGETPAETLRRELREETGLEVRPLKLLHVSTKRGLLTQFILLAECSGQPEIKSVEILEAGLFDLSELPGNLLPTHRELLEACVTTAEPPGLPLEERQGGLDG